MSTLYPGFFNHQRSMQSDQISGVWTALVTNNKDPENLGRVKVKLTHREDVLESGWIRVATPMSGNDRGMRFIPEVDDEVLISFIMGKPNQPVVIGSLWNKKDKLPGPASDKNDIRAIKTRSGHVIEFNDQSGEESITIKSKSGQTIEFSDKDKSITVQTSGGQNSVKLDGSGNKVTVKAGTSSVELTSQGDISITATKMVSVKAPQVKVASDGAMTIQSAGMLEIKTDGLLTLKGSMVKIN